jgi:hypothetical protein
LLFFKKRRKDVDNSFEKKFLRVLRRHLSHDYPNPKRIGCPGRQELDLLCTQPMKVEDWVVNHLMSCSPCYLVYSEILRKEKTKGRIGKTVRRKQRVPRKNLPKT